MADVAPMSLEVLAALDDHLSEEERLVRSSVRRFVRSAYLPQAPQLFEGERFPLELVPELAKLGLLGASLQGYECAGMGAVDYGLALQELEYGDSALRSFVSVQGSLAMYAIHAHGSEEQRARFLPRMARGELIGCFGLTEPDSGSDPGSMRTRARRSGSDWVLNGTKMWITNAPICHLAVVWAKVDDDAPSPGEQALQEQAPGEQTRAQQAGTNANGGQNIRGFLVERGTRGFETPRTRGKMSLRASETGEIVLDDCRIPAENLLPSKPGLGAPLSCLNQARFGIAWGALGAAKACYESAVDYVRHRRQFDGPLARKQLVQERLVGMASSIVQGEIMALHYARLKDRQGRLRPEQVSLCKRNNVAVALDAARQSRALLGANGILLDYPAIRHMLNLESVYTYEGTHEVHTLVLGKALTGESAL